MRLESPLTKVLEDACFTSNDIDEVVLVGGSTNIPWVKSWLLDYFG